MTTVSPLAPVGGAYEVPFPAGDVGTGEEEGAGVGEDAGVDEEGGGDEDEDGGGDEDEGGGADEDMMLYWSTVD